MSQGCCVDKVCTPETCMDLPHGTTCGDCMHIKRCLALGFTPSETETVCSFYPRRLRVLQPGETVAKVSRNRTILLPADSKSDTK